MADGRFALAAAVRVVVGVHDRAADGGLNAEVTGLAGFADADNLMLEIADLTYRSFARYGNEPHFTGRHFDCGVSALFCHYLRGDARRPCNLRAPAGLHFYRVNDRTYGDIRKSERVARLDVRAGTRYDLIAYVKTYGSENVSLFAVYISEESYVRRPVGVVLNALDRRGDTVDIQG